jgi:hypothetical protein
VRTAFAAEARRHAGMATHPGLLAQDYRTETDALPAIDLDDPAFVYK